MARFRYFSDTTGEPIELVNIQGMPNKEFAARFPGVKGRRYDGFSMYVGDPVGVREVVGQRFGACVPVTRIIDYKSQPSLHQCNGKCLNGKATGTCECRCGGKNHGRGMFTGLIAQAA